MLMYATGIGNPASETKTVTGMYSYLFLDHTQPTKQEFEVPRSIVQYQEFVSSWMLRPRIKRTSVQENFPSARFIIPNA